MFVLKIKCIEEEMSRLVILIKMYYNEQLIDVVLKNTEY